MKNIVNILSNDTAEMLMYGIIGMGGNVLSSDKYISSDYFMTELRKLESKYRNINIRINSPGGSVFEGIAILNAIRNSKANIITYNDGIAASMASALFLAGKKRYMSKFARLMTHQAKISIEEMNATQMREQADLLDTINHTLAQLYASMTGLSIADVKVKFLNEKDTYFTADEAKALKLIDDTYDGAPVQIPGTIKNQTEAFEIYQQSITNKATQHQPITKHTVIILSDENDYNTNNFKNQNMQPSNIQTTLTEYEKALLETGGWHQSCQGNNGYRTRADFPQLFIFFYHEKFGEYSSPYGITPDMKKQRAYKEYVDNIVLQKIDGLSYDELWRKNPKMLTYIYERFPEKYNTLYLRKWGRLPDNAKKK